MGWCCITFLLHVYVRKGRKGTDYNYTLDAAECTSARPPPSTFAWLMEIQGKRGRGRKKVLKENPGWFCNWCTFVVAGQCNPIYLMSQLGFFSFLNLSRALWDMELGYALRNRSTAGCRMPLPALFDYGSITIHDWLISLWETDEDTRKPQWPGPGPRGNGNAPLGEPSTLFCGFFCSCIRWWGSMEYQVR